MQEALLLQDRIHLVSLWVRVLASKAASKTASIEWLGSHSAELRRLVGVNRGRGRSGVLGGRWLSLLDLLADLNALGTLGIFVSLLRLGR